MLLSSIIFFFFFLQTSYGYYPNTTGTLQTRCEYHPNTVQAPWKRCGEPQNPFLLFFFCKSRSTKMHSRVQEINIFRSHLEGPLVAVHWARGNRAVVSSWLFQGEGRITQEFKRVRDCQNLWNNVILLGENSHSHIQLWLKVMALCPEK